MVCRKAYVNVIGEYETMLMLLGGWVENAHDMADDGQLFFIQGWLWEQWQRATPHFSVTTPVGNTSLMS